jgi:hypothetical protein
MIPGWPYSFVAALEPGRTSWTAVLDAVRLGPEDDETDGTAAQVRDVVERLAAAGHWHEGDPGILVVFDAGYDVTRLAWLLKDLPVEVLGRLRSDRVLYFPAPPRPPGAMGRPSRHGAELKLADEKTWPAPAVTTVTQTSRYGTATAVALGPAAPPADQVVPVAGALMDKEKQERIEQAAYLAAVHGCSPSARAAGRWPPANTRNAMLALPRTCRSKPVTAQLTQFMSPSDAKFEDPG